MDEFAMPAFRDEHGRVMVWDPTSHSYVVKTDDGLPHPDRGHATGGDNDLFNPFENTEQSGVPELEGYMASVHEGQEWAPKGHVKCPNCQEVTDDPACPLCGKDLTPEWNQEQSNEFMDVMPQHDHASEFTSWPIREPKRNRLNTDDSFPSETTARVWEAATKLASFKQITADEWDDLFSGQAPLKTEIGKWLIDKGGNLHIDHGMHALHENIAARDGINYPGDVGALGSVYNDGTADTQRVFPGFQFDQQAAQAQITQAFGPVTLQAPVGSAGTQQKGVSFEPFEIQGGQWVITPYREQQPITGIAWVKERSNHIPYQPNMILVAEHLQPEDFELWSRGVEAIITATGGLTSHAAYLASTEGIPVVVGIGEAYNKIETGNYLKVDPATQTITVMPAASGEMSPDQKQNVWDSYLQYQRQRGGSLKPEYFAHIDEELAWREANTPTLDSCPECGQPMVDQNGESVCHGCGHKQPIIQHQAGMLAMAPEILGIGGEAAGGLGSGMSGIGGIMTRALGYGAGRQLGENLVGDHSQGNLAGGGGGDAGTAGDSENFDSGAEAQGVISKVTEAGVLSILEGIVNVLQKTPEAFADPKNPLSYADDIAAAGLGGAGSAAASGLTGGVPGAPGAPGAPGGAPAGVISKNLLWDHLGAGAFGEEEVGRGTKNDGTNSTDDASKSSIEGEKEHGDSPEQLKDVDGMGGTDESMTKEKLQGDPALQDKALKAFHMNLPLVIEFANSDDAGADNPILRALDELLEEAFPGYKDGHDDAAAEDEHPVTEIHEEIHPEEKSDDDDDSDDKSGSKEASVWHYAEFEDALAELPEVTSEQNTDAEAAIDLWEHDAAAWAPANMPSPAMSGGFPSNNGDLNAMQAPGAGTCPMCGQSHLPGTPCPTPTNQVTAPAATGVGGQVTPPQPQTVVTKWQVVSVGQPVSQPVDDVSPGNVIAAYPDGTIVLDDGITTYNMQRAQEFAAQHGWSRDPNQQIASPTPGFDDVGVLAPGEGNDVGVRGPMHASADPEFAFFAAAGEGEHHHEHEVEHKPDHTDVHVDGGDTSEASTPWLDEAGAPLQEGAEYELKSSDYAIPDRVTIDRILPEKLVFTIHSGDVDYQDEISAEELHTNGYSFAPASPDHTGVDSMDGFDPSESPVRPGQDATPQVDDLSTPSTVVSHDEYEYMPKFAGDRLADRSWLLESKGGEVEVDPTLMAKIAGKNFSPREQRDFINEAGEARNLDRLDLDGTHYVLDGINTDDALW